MCEVKVRRKLWTVEIGWLTFWHLLHSHQCALGLEDITIRSWSISNSYLSSPWSNDAQSNFSHFPRYRALQQSGCEPGFPSLPTFRFAIRSVVFCGSYFSMDCTDIGDIMICGYSRLRYQDLDIFLDIGELASFRFILFALTSHPDGWFCSSWCFLAQDFGIKISNRITEVMLPYHLNMAKRIEEHVHSMMATIHQEKSFDLVTSGWQTLSKGTFFNYQPPPVGDLSSANL